MGTTSIAGLGSYLEYNHQFISQTVVPAVSGEARNGAQQGVAAGNNPITSGGAATPQKTASPSTPKSTTSPSTPSTSAPSSGSSSSPSAPTTPTSTANDKFGMSAPADKWNERLAQVGSAHIKFRRIFLQDFDDSLTKVSEAINAGMTPVISWKTGGYSWAQVAAGSADSKLNSLVARLNAISGPKFLAIHHEPAGDGSASDYVAMQLHALPILKTANNVTVGVIGNGWWWSARNQGYTDAEIAQWIPSSLKNICDVIAADTYQDEGLEEDGSVKAARLAAWAKRTGGVNAVGIGEFNGFTASSITNVMNVVKADPLFKWALVWNSGPSGLGTPLEGARLQAFITGKSTPDPT